MAGHKKQHFIPRSYLKAWCDPNTPPKQEPYVWQFSKDGETVKKKAPDNIFYETDMYTISAADGGRDLVLEHGLSGLESQFVNLRENKLKHHKPLDQQEHLALCTFVAAMDARTKARREHTSKEWGKVQELIDNMHERAKTFTPEEWEQVNQRAKFDKILAGNSPSMSEEEVRKIVAKPMQEMLGSIITALTPLLLMMDLVIVETNQSPGFITSDNPCIWFDPEAYKRPPIFQVPALMFESTEIRLPLSPQQMLIFKREFKALRGYEQVTDSAVDELNRITRFSAHEFFIVNSNEKKSVWFDPGTEPEDSWEKLHPSVKPPWSKKTPT